MRRVMSPFFLLAAMMRRIRHVRMHARISQSMMVQNLVQWYAHVPRRR